MYYCAFNGNYSEVYLNVLLRVGRVGLSSLCRNVEHILHNSPEVLRAGQLRTSDTLNSCSRNNPLAARSVISCIERQITRQELYFI